MTYTIEPIKGIFNSECKNRFISNVKVNNTLVECYVPSSSRIENYLNLSGCEVILTLNKSKKSRTKYALFAVKQQNEYIILNLNKVNTILENLIINKELYPDNNYKVYKEKEKKGYKSDLFLEENGNGILVEAKGVISKNKIVRFPQVISERSILQLKTLEKLLEQGIKAHYYLVALSPLINKIEIDTNSEFHYHLQRCINKGLCLRGIGIVFDGKMVRYSGYISIDY
ncbi:DNA/RNA nuclease SfsA [Bacillus zhangzhouensis]|uniref:DNA/RNA nuclease SfsA n=1 Tax=Bacillus zhangzhouensis TaxID=1178540 RepID=UPI003D1C6783